ncbi:MULTISPECIES: LexA family protein [Photobacterium]|uniref:S24 family peptidase n=1 Tax=Photobacterium piscicola TaxID=1378299 RepID=A0ABU6LHL9_9GAMM|nr:MULTISPECIES: S24 family peptidase [Photobacterium]MCD9523746.1 Cro/Cl family transcriptional regulator [Photobacterium carnosum]MEC6898840.1 S24 family peptidase [Photobacterium piscicola]
MVYGEDKAKEFAERLNSICERNKIPVRGRAGYLKDNLPFKISVVGVRKWLIGESIPDTKKLADIAILLGSSVEELISGNHGDNTISPVKTTKLDTNTVPVKARFVPIISWVQAGDFCSSETQVLPYDCDMILCPEPSASDKTFALRVVGDSMTAPFGRTYPEGTIIFVDPDKEPMVGKRVVARTAKGQTFKQLAHNEFGELYLKPLNPAHHPIFETDIHICGVVIGSYNPE